MKCSNCGINNEEKFNYCVKCGINLKKIQRNKINEVTNHNNEQQTDITLNQILSQHGYKQNNE